MRLVPIGRPQRQPGRPQPNAFRVIHVLASDGSESAILTVPIIRPGARSAGFSPPAGRICTAAAIPDQEGSRDLSGTNGLGALDQRCLGSPGAALTVPPAARTARPAHPGTSSSGSRAARTAASRRSPRSVSTAGGRSTPARCRPPGSGTGRRGPRSPSPAWATRSWSRPEGHPPPTPGQLTPVTLPAGPYFISVDTVAPIPGTTGVLAGGDTQA